MMNSQDTETRTCFECGDNEGAWFQRDGRWFCSGACRREFIDRRELLHLEGDES